MDNLISAIHDKARRCGRLLTLMELCGTHTQTVARYNLKSLLPKNIKLLTGPGCPVCVTDQSDIDAVVELALAGIPVATYGDVIGVPGSKMSLEQARQQGAKIHAIYSIAEAMALAKSYKLKAKELIFFGLGFETTAPMTAWAIKQGITVYSAHKLFPPAMQALLDTPELKIDGFICPGHVSAVIGTKPYQQFKVPQVIAGFEPEDVLKAIDMLLGQILAEKPRVENEYSRLVKTDGNEKSLRLMSYVFKTIDARWRGLGVIPNSGLELKEKYKTQNAKIKYAKIISKIPNLACASKSKVQNKTCLCSTILRGLSEPRDCPLFGKKCKPEKPQGACMVSVEGACNVAFRY